MTASLPAPQMRMACSLSMTEDLTEVFAQGIDEDAFDRLILSGISIVLAASFRGAQADPVRSPVTGAGEPFSIDECLGQDRLMGIEIHPVRTETAQASPQQMGGQVRDPDPGQYEKAGVVEHLEQIGFSGGRIPADESIPAVHLPCGRSPQEAGNRSLIGQDEILDMLPYGLTVPEVMIGIDEAVEKGLVRTGSSHLSPLDRPQVLEGTLDGGCVDRKWSSPGSSAIVWRLFANRRQCDQSLPVEANKQGPADAVAQKSVALPPVPLDANLTRESASAHLRIRVDEILDELNLLGANRTATEGDLCAHVSCHSTDEIRTPVGERKYCEIFC